MGTNRARELRIKNFQQDLDKLEKDYNALAEKKRRESNPQEQNNLQLQLEHITNQVEDIQQELQKLKQQQEKDNIESLLEILTNFKENSSCITRAYRACSPEGWTYVPNNDIEEIFADVEKMPKGSSKYTKVEHFVACLVADSKNSSSAFRQLKQWAEENINEFSELLNQEINKLNEKKKNGNSYLLIVFDQSNQKSAITQKVDYYTVKAWIIEDSETYNYETGVGCEPITLPEFDEKSFAIDEIDKILNKCLEEIIKYDYNYLTIEIFLPLAVLNHPVDCCRCEDKLDLGLNNTLIGQDYRVVVRSSERLTDYYKRLRKDWWEPKWKILQQFTQPSACSAFILGDEENVNDLIYELRLQTNIGLKIVKAPKNIGKGSIFAAILKTGIPVALWLKKNTENLDCQSEIEQILSGRIHDLPETIRRKREDAQDSDTHIGHHLSLLWEDPYRLPPSINYSM